MSTSNPKVQFSTRDKEIMLCFTVFLSEITSGIFRGPPQDFGATHTVYVMKFIEVILTLNERKMFSLHWISERTTVR